MGSLDRHQREALDRHITGNYGEDQFDMHDADGIDGFGNKCQVSTCQQAAEDGVLCTAHLAEQDYSDELDARDARLAGQ